MTFLSWFIPKQCEAAFEKINTMLANYAVTTRPVSDGELQFYVVVLDEVIGIAMIQETPKPKLIYFVNRVF